MANIEFKGIDKYQQVLADILTDTEKICKMAVYDGAAIIADAVRAEYQHIEHPYAENHDLINHMGLSPMRDDNGYINTRLGFSGYLENGAPAALVARVLESGSSNDHQQKKPFIRPGVQRAKARAEAAIDAQLDKQLERYTK